MNELMRGEMEPIQVEGKRIENIESVKKELDKRPGSSILIEERQPGV